MRHWAFLKFHAREDKGVKPLASPGYCLDFEKPLVELERQIRRLEIRCRKNIDMSEEIRRLQEKADQIKQEIYSNLTTWQRIQIARHQSAQPSWTMWV